MRDDVCSSHGVCLDNNKCTCDIGYMGEKCDLPVWSVVLAVVGGTALLVALLTPLFVLCVRNQYILHKQRKTNIEMQNLLKENLLEMVREIFSLTHIIGATTFRSAIVGD